MPIGRGCGLAITACLLVTSGFAQQGDAEARVLVQRAMEELARGSSADRAAAERLLQDAYAVRGQTAGSRADAATKLALFLLGERRPVEAIRPVAQDAVRLYELESPPVEDARMATALEVMDTVALMSGEAEVAAAARERARGIRLKSVPEAAGPQVAIDWPRRTGMGVTAPVPIAKPEPQYSDEARLARRQGSVLLAIVIDAAGVPQNIRLVRGLGLGLDEMAARAVSTWRFRPSTLNGEAVPVKANVEVNFRLL